MLVGIPRRSLGASGRMAGVGASIRRFPAQERKFTSQDCPCNSGHARETDARGARRLPQRASNQVDPQQVTVFAAGVALCVPALLTVKLVHAESVVCGALIGVAVMLKVLAVGTVIVTV